MQASTQRITPFLWFDDQAEEPVAFYTSVFDNSRVVSTTRYGKESEQVSGRPAGSVMTIAFQLDGQDFTALNGGPHFKFNEAISLVVNCQSQDEVDHYSNRLSEGGDEKAQQCGWLKDRYGVSWQIVPTLLIELLSHPDPEKARRATEAVLQMKKIDVAALRRAVERAPRSTQKRVPMRGRSRRGSTAWRARPAGASVLSTPSRGSASHRRPSAARTRTAPVRAWPHRVP